MSGVTITLTDDNGAVACHVDFGGPIDENSPAHQHAGMMIEMMDGLYAKGEEAPVGEQPQLEVAGG